MLRGRRASEGYKEDKGEQMILKKFSERIFANKKLVLLLLIINVIGFFYGLYYYQAQIEETPAYLWIFTLDSPIPVLLFAAICVFLYRKKEAPQLLLIFAIIGLIKSGLWTDIVLILEWNYFFGFSPLITAMNLPLHAGMILEGIVLMTLLKKEKIIRNLSIAVAFFLVNDYLDYFFGTVTSIPGRYKGLLAYEAFLSTVLIIAAIYAYKKFCDKKQ